MISKSRTRPRRRKSTYARTRRPATRRSSGGRRAQWEEPRRPVRLFIVIAGLFAVNLYVFLWRGGTSIPDVMEQAAMASAPAAAPVPVETESVPAASVAAPSLARTSDGSVVSGDSLGQILVREGVPTQTSDRLLRGLGKYLDFRKIRAGQRYEIVFDAHGAVQSFTYHLSRVLRIRVVRQSDGSYAAAEERTPTEIRATEVGGVVESSLYAALLDRGEDTALVSFFVDIFASDINFYLDTHRGDVFRLLIEKEYIDGEFYRYGKVLAAEYSGRVGTYQAFRWQLPGEQRPRYFDAKGRSVAKTFLKTPLKFARISSRFDRNRMHPILHRRRAHLGVDYAAPKGTPVWAAASGRLTYRSRHRGMGNAVILKHANGLETVYMHLSRFARGQRVGQHIQQKTVIGYVGSTGMSTGPHLHFSIKKNGHYVDPQKLKMTPGVPVPGKYLAQYQADIGTWETRLAQMDPAATRDRRVAAPKANAFVGWTFEPVRELIGGGASGSGHSAAAPAR